MCLSDLSRLGNGIEFTQRWDRLSPPVPGTSQLHLELSMAKHFIFRVAPNVAERSLDMTWIQYQIWGICVIQADGMTYRQEQASSYGKQLCKMARQRDHLRPLIYSIQSQWFWLKHAHLDVAVRSKVTECNLTQSTSHSTYSRLQARKRSCCDCGWSLDTAFWIQHGKK